MVTTQVAPPAYSGLASEKTSTNASATGAVSTGTSNREISSDFETFLRMLTVQMQNQDPLNPVDSSDYAVQLATFSSVEQQVLTNDLLRALGDQMGGGALSQLAGWVGMEALARAPVAFDGSPIHLRPEHASDADAAKLVVRDSAGSVVSRETLPLGEDSVIWAGVDATGATYPSGTYSFEVESYQSGKVIESTAALAFSTVQEARISGEKILLRLSDGSEIESTLVTGMRAPD
ncbi:flagellar hook capping FlgD N-terminal domain-containing protein [Puniceibacterium sediminis]|uniref:Basal-body rod modification protein FlgD n=1 Tax=Puniceibacterium sediminis TaxID=1608407 RepID=A0A238WTY2_9RHOB|nr:flagellar hook capping FlgD N-terminal domain-containing protein [Puniceibacterium sediminis]SNR49955.1 flagellar basal-body rod modification protein FlgD [Puniceibacterium sediminis]